MLLLSSLPNLPSSLGVLFLRRGPRRAAKSGTLQRCRHLSGSRPAASFARTLQHPHLTWRFVFFSPSTFLILRPGLRRPAALRPLNHAQDTKTAVVIVDTTRHGPSNRNEADGRRRGATTDDRRRQKQHTGDSSCGRVPQSSTDGDTRSLCRKCHEMDSPLVRFWKAVHRATLLRSARQSHEEAATTLQTPPRHCPAAIHLPCRLPYEGAIPWTWLAETLDTHS
ncbi:hypothetical protein RB213_012484 [Colletotrichum asianum]